MTAGQLLGRHVWAIMLLGWLPVRGLGGGVRLGTCHVTRLHLLSADNTCTIGHLRQFWFGRVGIAPVHVTSGVVVADEGTEAGDEGAGGNEDVPNDVQGKTVECEDDHEECHVRCELEEVWVRDGLVSDM